MLIKYFEFIQGLRKYYKDADCTKSDYFHCSLHKIEDIILDSRVQSSASYHRYMIQNPTFFDGTPNKNAKIFIDENIILTKDNQEFCNEDKKTLVRFLNAHQDKLYDEGSKFNLRERAEKYTYDEFINMETINGRLYFQLCDFIVKNCKYPLFLLGDRGFGKTFNTFKAISDILYYGHRSNPQNLDFKISKDDVCIFLFKENERLESMDIYSGIRQKVDIENIFSLTEKAKLVVFDDIHYMCENAIDGKLSIAFLTEFLRTISNICKNKRVILISDEPLLYYAEYINSKKFDAILPRFGEKKFDNSKKFDANEQKRQINKVSWLSKLLVPPLDVSDFSYVVLLSNGKKIDSFVAKFMCSNLTCNLRSPVRFVNLFNTNEITREVFINTAMERLKKMGADEIYITLCKYPELSLDANNKITDETSIESLEKAPPYQQMEQRFEKMIEEVDFENTHEMVVNNYLMFFRSIKATGYSHKYYNLRQSYIESFTLKEQRELDRLISQYEDARGYHQEEYDMAKQIAYYKKMQEIWFRGIKSIDRLEANYQIAVSKNDKKKQSGIKSKIRRLKEKNNLLHLLNIEPIPKLKEWNVSVSDIFLSMEYLREKINVDKKEFGRIWKEIQPHYRSGIFSIPFEMAFEREIFDDT